MANKLSIDVQMNSEGYVRGAQQATQATNDLDKSTKDYLSQFDSLKKEMNAAKKEAMNLAQAYAQLSKTEKSSDFGKEIKAQLDIAIEKAGELQDVFADTQQAIKNAASDTAGWDAMKQGFDIGKSAAMTYASAIAQVTGDTESLTKLVKTLTMIENGFNTVIKVGNALQKQSAIMTGIRRIQNLAAAKAIEAEKSATVGATAAQRVFNAVAKANPYVLLATVAIAAAAAIGGYMLATKKATKEDEIRATTIKNLKNVQDQYISSLSNKYGELMGKYNELRTSWRNLSSEHEKAKWIKENKTKLQELGIAVKTVKEAEDSFGANSAKVIEGFRKRAEAAALAAQAVNLYTQAMELEQRATKRLQEIGKKAGDKATANDFNEGRATYNNRTGEYEYTEKGAKEANMQLWESDKALKQMRDEYNEVNNLLDQNVNKQEKISNELRSQAGTTNEIVNKNDKKEKTEVDPNIKLSEKVGKQLQKDLTNQLKENTKNAAAGIQKIKLDIGSFMDVDINKAKTLVSEALSSGNGVFKDVEKSWDFSYLSDGLQQEAERGQKKLEVLSRALADAGQAKAKFAKAGNTEGVQQMDEQINKLTEDYNKQYQALDQLSERSQKIGDLSKAFDMMGSQVGQIGGAFSALGDALDDTTLKAFGIIAETIANIMLSFSQALVQAAAMGPWAWIAFGIQGIAQVAALIAQIKNLSAGSYAEGGVIPGSSFTGDKLWARVNSGERVLTAKQNKRLEEIANSVSGAGIMNGQVVQVQGVIRGKDLLLVQKNYNEISKHAGQSIKIY